MTPERAKRLLPIIEDFAEGKTVQENIGGMWRDLPRPKFDRAPEAYRIKPKLIKVEAWAIVDNHGKLVGTARSLRAAKTSADQFDFHIVPLTGECTPDE